jgi:aminobenzoyl-glutamate utilization protein B
MISLGSVYMLRAGLFRDVDACLAWHPDDKIEADVTSTQAMIDFRVEFAGRSAHAAADPWNGRSAVDALELCTHALNLMREHVKPTVRIHYVIEEGGNVPNVIADRARLWCWVRDLDGAGAEHVFERARRAAEGAALATETTADVRIQAGSHEMLVLDEGARLLQRNLEALGPIVYTDEEQAFARAIQKATGVPEKGLDGSVRSLEGQEFEGGSTDVAEVSWNVPTLHVSVTTAAYKAPWHSWAVVACGGMSIGHKGLVHAAKVLAATGVDLFEQPEARARLRAEFERKTAGRTYRPFIPDGPPPVPTE